MDRSLEMYFDSEGYPMSLYQWGRLFESRQRWKIQTTIKGPAKSSKWVSTVWLGLNHRWGDDGLPLIFETMVFNMSGGEIDCYRTSTKEEATIVHWQMVEYYTYSRAQRRRKTKQWLEKQLQAVGQRRS